MPGLSLCSAKRTQLLNPGLGFGIKEKLRSCKGPYGFLYLFPPFSEKDRRAVMLNTRTKVNGKWGEQEADAKETGHNSLHQRAAAKTFFTPAHSHTPTLFP